MRLGFEVVKVGRGVCEEWEDRLFFVFFVIWVCVRFFYEFVGFLRVRFGFWLFSYF